MGAFKEMLIEQAEWLEEKLNSVIPDDMSEYGFDECQELIIGDIPWGNKVLATHLWKIAQLSPEDGNRLMDISEDLYLFAMEQHCECADSVMRSDTPLSHIKEMIYKAKGANRNE